MGLPTLDFSKITYCGIRDIDDFEASIIKDKNIRVLGVTETIDYIERCTHPVHISFDVDAIDPQFIDATGTPVDGGLYPDEVRDIIEAGLNTKNLVSLDVVEFNSELGDKDMSFKNLKDVFVKSHGDDVSDTA